MKKLDLVGMISDKDEILDLMQKTSAVEIISVKQGEEQISNGKLRGVFILQR